MLSNSKHTKKNVDAVKSQVCLVKGPKPLIRHIFYLDIKNHVVESKIQAKIKQLGGTIELFLVRDVTHVVTDKPISTSLNTSASESTPKTNTPIQQASNDSHNSTLDSPFGTATQTRIEPTPTTRRKPRSRTDAMLERARLQSANTSTAVNPINPIENARNWGIPVWSVEKVLHWLGKVAAAILAEFKVPYLKFEPAARDARPILKQFPIWPMINLNVETGVSPFVITEQRKESPLTPSPSITPSTTAVLPAPTAVKYQNTDRHNKKRKMIRKTRISLRGIKITDHNQITNHPQAENGYCEICRVDYQDLTKHVRSESHLRFVRDDTNFLSLDSLITAGANVEAFLRLNGTTKDDGMFSNTRRSSLRLNASVKNEIEIKINGDTGGKRQLLSSPAAMTMVKHSLSPTIPRTTRSSSACEKTVKELSPAPISPALSDNGHHLRSRGQLWLPSNLLGTTAEDEGRPIKPSLLARSNSKPSESNVLQVNKSLDYESDDEIPLIKHIKKKLVTPKSSPKHSPKPSPKNSPLNSPKHTSVKVCEPKKEQVKPLKKEVKEQVKDLKKDTKEQEKDLKKDGQEKVLMERGKEVKNETIKELKKEQKSKKRATPDDILITENRAYYKVEVLSSKLRSSAIPIPTDISKSHPPTSNKEEKGENKSSDNKSLVVKFKRIRKSELSTLSNEAENFMFPRKDGSSDEQEDMDTDEDRNTTQESQGLNRSTDSIKTSEVQTPHNDYTDEGSSQDCSGSVLSSCESTRSESKPRKHRRTHAEVFIQDNEKYYKFETPGSRLRFQGSFLPLMTGATTPLTHHTKTIEKPFKTEPKIKKEQKPPPPQKTEPIKEESEIDLEVTLSKYKTLPSIDRLTFTYERLTKKEIKRIQQAQNEQIKRDFELFCEQFCRKPSRHILPFQRSGAIIPKDPKNCKEAFMKKLEQPLPPPRPPSSDRTNFSEANSLIDSSDHTDQISNSSSKQSLSGQGLDSAKQRRKKQKRYDSTEGKSRKSPRQHASTLAILGGLLTQIPYRRKSKLDSEASDADIMPLTPINEESFRSACPSPQLSEQPREPPEHPPDPPEQSQNATKFVLDFDNWAINDEEIQELDFIVFDHDRYNSTLENHQFDDEFNLINILNTYRESNTLETGAKETWNKNMPAVSSKLNSSSLFTPKEFRRKRKPNRTGWPSVVRRPLTRRLQDSVTSRASAVNDSSVCGENPSEPNSEIVNSVNSVNSVRKGRRGRRRTKLINRLRDNSVESIENKENNTGTVPGPSDLLDHSELPPADVVIVTPSRKSSRNPSSDCLGFTTEECGVDVEKWKATEALIHNASADPPTCRRSSRRDNSDKRSSIEFQPYVKVQKIESLKKLNNRRLRSSSSPSSRSMQPNTKRIKLSTQSTKIKKVSPPPSPRKLRRPRGRWYRDR